MTKKRPRKHRPISQGSKRQAREPLVDFVYHALLQRIVSGVLAAGETVSELALSQELGVSRTPVHNAVRQLAADGLVFRHGRQRAKVATFSQDDLHEVFEMRKLLEVHAAKLAASRMNPQQLSVLRAKAKAMRDLSLDDPAWVVQWADFDELFHRDISQASGNRRLASDISRYHLLHSGMNRLSTTAVVLQSALAEHESILDAIEARDAKVAANRMHDHIATWQAYFSEKMFPSQPDRS